MFWYNYHFAIYIFLGFCWPSPSFFFFLLRPNLFLSLCDPWSIFNLILLHLSTSTPPHHTTVVALLSTLLLFFFSFLFFTWFLLSTGGTAGNEIPCPCRAAWKAIPLTFCRSMYRPANCSALPRFSGTAPAVPRQAACLDSPSQHQSLQDLEKERPF